MARYLHIWRATLRSEYPQLRDRVQEDLPFPVRFQPIKSSTKIYVVYFTRADE